MARHFGIATIAATAASGGDTAVVVGRVVRPHHHFAARCIALRAAGIQGDAAVHKGVGGIGDVRALPVHVATHADHTAAGGAARAQCAVAH
ncbi:hypothetical protein GCM10007901_06520 [Dyella acidisoli]|uniref:Uncharacterized protein n=1 Tax=Dyella acidisoli TaxID=1867834 RepID=A0ABQ5XJA9_9GAMM|nr:hypothetical protein GCM10007901_06520 [Dyella acidisoli]